MKPVIVKMLTPLWLWLNNRCIIDGCEFPRYSDRLCKMHYRHWKWIDGYPEKLQ